MWINNSINRHLREALEVKYAMIIGVIVGIAGAIGSIIYIRNIYNDILTAMPLWMIIGLILLIWTVAITVFLIVCFVLKKYI